MAESVGIVSGRGVLALAAMLLSTSGCGRVGYDSRGPDGSESGLDGSTFPSPDASADADGSPPLPDGSSTTVAEVLYVATASGVSAHYVDWMTGQLSSVPGSPFTSRASPLLGIAVDATSSIVAVTGQGPSRLASYRVDVMSGALTEVRGPDISTPAARVLTAHPTLPVFYGADLCTLVQLAADPGTGELALESMVAVPVPCSPYSVAVDPLGRWIFAPGAGSTFAVDVATLDARGRNHG
jgi:hypothetical protein